MKFEGTVIRGTGKGKQTGFATANLKIPDDFDLEQGVYAVKVEFEGTAYKGALHFGPKPVFSEINDSLEVHILGFEGDLYGQSLRLDVIEKIRNILMFDTIDLLKHQLKKDCEKVENIVEL